MTATSRTPTANVPREMLRVDDARQQAYRLCMKQNIQRDAKRCSKCDGFLLPDTTLDLHTGVSIHELVCVNCGRRRSQESGSS
jgi:hypothetical protein